MSKAWKDKKNWVIFALVCLCVWLFFGKSSPQSSIHGAPEAEVLLEPAIYTCSMDPQIKLPEPGLCPICGMDLIPLEADGEDQGPWTLTLSESARRLAGIRTAPAQRKRIAHEVRMVGRVDYDEKRLSDITARVDGRVDRLYVDFTGIAVNKGDHMVELYSPDLITAQQELRQAIRAYENGPESLRKATARRMAAARRKIELFGLSKRQIRELEQEPVLTDHITVESPMSGIVIKKHLHEGAYVKTGQAIYTIADLSRVWIVLEAFETDLRWLRFGQEVNLEIAAFPEEPISGRIVFIEPTLDPVTRTVKLRMDVPNPDGRLKPDMFVRGTAYATLSPNGKVMDPSLAGKWISPMHPEVVKNGPGSCDVCGMDLVKAESLGFVTVQDDLAPLIIPASAPLITGERAVVYVADPQEEGVFSGREIVLGPQTSDFFVVKDGLREGEQVVVKGAFKIDSEMQIRAKNSMMYPPEQKAKAVQKLTMPASFLGDARPVLEAYFAVQKALSQDAFEPAATQVKTLEKHYGVWAETKLQPAELAAWEKARRPLDQAIEKIQKSKDIESLRQAFQPLSDAFYGVFEKIGWPEESPVYRFHCPMAFDDTGADWLQNEPDLQNPYFGSRMYRCGTRLETLVEPSEKAHGEGDGHEH